MAEDKGMNLEHAAPKDEKFRGNNASSSLDKEATGVDFEIMRVREQMTGGGTALKPKGV